MEKVLKILVLIDCQNDFITGSLRNEEAIKTVPNVVKKIREFNGSAIFYTQDTHEENYLETNEGRRLPFEHCIKDTDGWKLEPNVQAAITDATLRNIPAIKIEKPTFGSFQLVNFINGFLDVHRGADVEIEFCGYCTDICVVSNVLMTKAALYEKATISVDASCCAGVTPESHKAALLTMKMCQVDINNE